MELEYLPQAEKDLEEFQEEHEEKIRNKISELREDTTGHPDVSLVDIKGEMLFRLKITEEKLDYRAVFDIIDGKIYVSNIFNRKNSEYHELEPDFQN